MCFAKGLWALEMKAWRVQHSSRALWLLKWCCWSIGGYNYLPYRSVSRANAPRKGSLGRLQQSLDQRQCQRLEGGPRQKTPASFEPENMGSGGHQLEPVPRGVGQGGQTGHDAWQDTCPLAPERLLHTPRYAAVSSTVLGSRSLSAGSTGLTHNAGFQAGFCRGLEIVKQHPGIAALNMGTWVTAKDPQA